MSYFLSVLLLILNFIKKNRKYIFCFFAIFIWILSAWCYSNADTIVYQLRYQYPNLISTEPLFNLIIYFCHVLNMTFEQYRIFFVGIFYLSFFCVIYKVSENYNFTIALYFIFPFFFDAVQLRQFCANILVIIGIVLLNKYKKIWIYILFCAMAIMLHASEIFMMLLILAFFLDITVIMIIALITVVVVYNILNPGIIYFFSELLNISSKAENVIREINLSTDTQILHYLFYFAIGFFGGIMLLYLEKKLFGKELKPEENRFIDFMIKCHVISLVSVALIMRGAIDFNRLQYSIIAASYFAYSYITFLNKNKYGNVIIYKKKLIFNLLCVLYSFVLLYVWILSNNNYFTVFESVMKNNLIF